MKFIVKKLDGEQFDVEIENDDCDVSELKAVIESTNDIQCERQRLIFRGRELINGNSINTYGLTDGSILHLVVRPDLPSNNNNNNNNSNNQTQMEGHTPPAAVPDYIVHIPQFSNFFFFLFSFFFFFLFFFLLCCHFFLLAWGFFFGFFFGFLSHFRNFFFDFLCVL